MEDWRKRVQRLMDENGLDMRTLSRRAGLGDTYVRDAIKRNRGGSIEAMAAIARVLGTSVNYLMTGVEISQPPVAKVKLDASLSQIKIYILGEVAAGVWVEETMSLSMADAVESVFPADPRYPIDAQYDLVVRGTSIDKIAREGDLLRCIDVVKAGIEVRDGDLVICRRTRGQLVEVTAKRVRRRAAGAMELWPESTDPRWQEPILVGGDDAGIEVIAICTFTYAAIGRA